MYIYKLQPILYIVIRPDDVERFLVETCSRIPTKYVFLTDCHVNLCLITHRGHLKATVYFNRDNNDFLVFLIETKFVLS